MSPLLFALYINDLGTELNSTNLGIDLQHINITCVMFADDIVLLGKTRDALDKLMEKTRNFFSSNKLLISDIKSKVITYNAATGTTSFEGSTHPPLHLEQVLCFKYLGIQVNCSPYNLFKSFNENVKKKARNYLSSVMSLSRSGPNRSELAYTLWTSCGLPSILYGSEVIPLTQGTIAELELCNTLVGKFMLQIPRSSANVACYIDAGLRPISAIVAEKVLLYAHSLMAKPSSYWPKLAMNFNISSGSLSPYTRYLLKWKSATNCFNLLPTYIRNAVRRSSIIDVLNQQRSVSTTTFAMLNTKTGPSGPNSKWFKPKSWITDSGFSQIYSSFRVCNSGLGNRGPAKNGEFYKLCHLCADTGTVALNNEVQTIITVAFSWTFLIVKNC